MFQHRGGGRDLFAVVKIPQTRSTHEGLVKNSSDSFMQANESNGNR